MIKSSNQITFTEQKRIIEIKEWYLASNQNTGITRDTEGWSTDVQAIDNTKNYLWNWEEIIYSIGESDKSEPIIISSYGKGILNIVNYYQITQNLIAPSLPSEDEESSWSDVSIIANLSPTNKYLWSYETIIYTDGSVTTTDPVVIGVYGDSGEDAITFEIYSTDGFIFKENVEEIELKIAAFQGITPITNATYTWEWWDESLNDGKGGYTTILENTELLSLTINKKDIYAFSHLKCTMLYDGNTYEDHIDLSEGTVIYSASVNFFSGSNVFDNTSPYLIAYVNLYRNNVLIESVLTNKYYIGENSVSDGIIATDIQGTFADNDLIYFIYENEITYTEEDEDGSTQEIINIIPCAILGQYQSGIWNVYNNENEYVYANDVYPHFYSNVIVISRENVSRSRFINFQVYKKQIGENGEFVINNELYLSTINTTVIDINDPIVSSTTPENVNYGQLWLDTSSTPYMLYIYTQVDGQDTGSWEYFSQQNGGVVFTSQPSSYHEGDIWILADGEICEYEKNSTQYRFLAGSMLKAIESSTTYQASHWIDADSVLTELKTNIAQTFSFNPGNDPSKGLPGLTIGQKDNYFYTNISSTEMGFYDNSNGQNQKVVSISNNSADILNPTFNGPNGSVFNNNAIFNQQISMYKSGTTDGFGFIIEENGSFSLAILI